MSLRALPSIRSRRILLVESEPRLLHELMNALEENEGAETFHVSDPHSDVGIKRIASFSYCAAAINSVHRNAGDGLKVPVLIYGTHSPVPAQVGAIVGALKEMLAERALK